MTNERFNEIVDEIIEEVIRKTLVRKGDEYALNGDRLQNFKDGAGILGGTPAQTCWAYLCKHLSSIRAIINDNAKTGKKFSKQLLREKYGDLINYGILFAALAEETLQLDEGESNDRNKSTSNN